MNCKSYTCKNKDYHLYKVKIPVIEFQKSILLLEHDK
jgi:hypothetical protein